MTKCLDAKRPTKDMIQPSNKLGEGLRGHIRYTLRNIEFKFFSSDNGDDAMRLIGQRQGILDILSVVDPELRKELQK